jgi:hypothetical protein
MAIDEQFRAVISVDDRTAAPIRRIQQSLAGIAQTSGLARLGQVTGRLSASMGGLARATASIAAPLAVVGALGAGAGLVALMRVTVDAAGALTDLSARTGITVENLQALQFAAGQAGIGPEQLTGSLERLSRGMADASRGKNKDLAALFSRMRIPLRDGNRRLRGVADVLPQIADALKNTRDPAVRTAAAFALFGRAGGPMLAMMADGSDGLKEMMQRWVELDGSINSANKGSLDEVGDAWNEVTTAMAGVRNAIVVRLAPALAPLFKQLATWISLQKEWLANGIRDGVLGLAEAIREIDFKQAIIDAGQFLKSVNEGVKATIGWKNAFIGLGALLAAPFAAAALSAIVSLGKIIAFLGGPVTVAIAGIGTAIVLAWKYWDQIKGFVEGVNTAMKRLQDDAIAAVLAGFREILGVVERIMAAWDRGQAFQSPAAPEPGQGQRRMGGRAGGLYPGGMRDPDTGEPVFPQRQSLTDPAATPDRRSLWRTPAPALPQRVETDVNVRFENSPPGMRADAEVRGAGARAPNLNVGYARMGVA